VGEALAAGLAPATAGNGVPLLVVAAGVALARASGVLALVSGVPALVAAAVGRFLLLFDEPQAVQSARAQSAVESAILIKAMDTSA